MFSPQGDRSESCVSSMLPILRDDDPLSSCVNLKIRCPLTSDKFLPCNQCWKYSFFSNALFPCTVKASFTIFSQRLSKSEPAKSDVWGFNVFNWIENQGSGFASNLKNQFFWSQTWSPAVSEILINLQNIYIFLSKKTKGRPTGNMIKFCRCHLILEGKVQHREIKFLPSRQRNIG